MKTLKQLAFFLLVGTSALFTSSCNNDDNTVDNTPAITVVPSKTTAAPGETVTFKITVSANNTDLKTLTIKQSTNGNTAGQIFDTTFSNRTSSTLNYEYLVSGNNNDKNTFTFTITDKNGLTNSTEQTITVSGTGATDVNLCSNVKLGSYSNSTYGSSFASSTCTVYKVADARSNSAMVDFLYFYGSTNNATLAAPNDAAAESISTFDLANWSTRNATMLKKLSGSFDFSGATSTSIQTAYGTGGDSKVNNLAVGDMVGFVTAAGKYGVAKVKAISGGASGTITLDVKTQK